MKQDIKKYWNYYYKLKRNNNKPSNFSYFIKKNYLNKKDVLLDIGTGDGRDAFYFNKKVKLVYGIDQSIIAIKKNNLIIKQLKLNNIKFQNLSITNLNYFKSKKITFVYARFFLHAIDEIKENIFLNNLTKNFNQDLIIALEFRTVMDKLMNQGKKISRYERITDHYRRFIDVKKFNKKLKDRNFKILYQKLGINLSKTADDNPHLCRIIFKPYN